MESQGEYVEEGEDLQRQVDEAWCMLKKLATEENIAKGSAVVMGRGKSRVQKVIPLPLPLKTPTPHQG